MQSTIYKENYIIPPQKSQAKESLAGEFYADVRGLERESGVIATEIADEALANAEEAVEENVKTQIKEDAKDVMAVAGTAAAVTLGIAGAAGATIAEVVENTGAKLLKKDDKKEKNDDDEEDVRRHLTPEEEAMRRRGF